MLNHKKLDGVCLNFIDNKNSFGSDNNNIELITENQSIKIDGVKLDVSLSILENLKRIFDEK